MNNYLNTIGLVISFIGSIFFTLNLFMSKKEIIKLGVSRWASDKDEENVKLPQVQDRIKQRNFGIIGMILISVGFLLQLMSQIL